MSFSAQSEYDIRCEWGLKGVEILAPTSDAIIIVDVMSFSTAVSVAVSRGAIVFPYRWKDESGPQFAKRRNALLAGPRGEAEYSLSPLSMMKLHPGARIVLPSPNGSTLSLSTGNTPTFAGSLRNAEAAARAAMKCGTKVAVIPCGERWPDDLSLRPAFEDFVGAGAIITHLAGTRSPEAEAAQTVFEANMSDLPAVLTRCSSGRELTDMGFLEDISLTAVLNVDSVAPMLKDSAFVETQ